MPLPPELAALDPEELLRLRGNLPPEQQAEFDALLLQVTLPFIPKKLPPELETFGPLWLKGTAPDTWTWDWPHQQFIYDALGKVTRNECKRLQLSIPPRHTKTETMTVRYAAWRIERDPTCRVIVAAYNQDQANLYARKIRRIVAPRVKLAKDSNKVDDWETLEGGGLRAVGVGAGVTGRGAHLILIDDPVKSREEADSEVYRKRVWEWYTDDLWTRQEPGCAIALVMTRWHEDDLAGRLLKAAQGDDEFAEQWLEINLPALAMENDPLGRKPGEALCPDRYDVEYFERAKTVLKRNFWALFQGDPRPPGGTLFKEDWWRYFRIEGEFYVLQKGEHEERVRALDCRIIQAVDLAASEKKTADYFADGTYAVTPAQDLLLLDVLREQQQGPEVKKDIRDLHDRWQPAQIGIERNGLGLPIVQDLQAGEWAQGGVYLPPLPVKPVQAHRDKVSRAGASAALYEAGKVYHLEAAAWVSDWEDEHLSFPNGKNDDMVDVGSIAATMVAHGGTVFSEFAHHLHVHHSHLPVNRARPLLCGWAHEPCMAWVLCQLTERNQLGVLASGVGDTGEGVYGFGARVNEWLQREIGLEGVDLRHFGHPNYLDPNGSRAEERAVAEILNRGLRLGRDEGERKPGFGFRLRKGEASRKAREAAIRGRLTLILPGGMPALVVDPGAKEVQNALAGGYAYKLITNTGYFTEDPEVNPSMAVVDALGHVLCRLFAEKQEPDREGYVPQRRVVGPSRGGR